MVIGDDAETRLRCLVLNANDWLPGAPQSQARMSQTRTLERHRYQEMRKIPGPSTPEARPGMSFCL